MSPCGREESGSSRHRLPHWWQHLGIPLRKRKEKCHVFGAEVPWHKHCGHEQTQDLRAEFWPEGFQFERLVTGQEMYGLHDLTTHEHLQLLRIGKFRVLVTAEVDAVDDQGRPVEIKSGDPRFFGIKEMLQMISSGSQLLIHPYTKQLEVMEILRKPIEDLAHQAGSEELQKMDGRIVAAFQQLDASKQSMTDEPYRIILSNGHLQLASQGETLLPLPQVIEELLEDDEDDET